MDTPNIITELAVEKIKNELLNKFDIERKDMQNKFDMERKDSAEAIATLCSKLNEKTETLVRTVIEQRNSSGNHGNRGNRGGYRGNRGGYRGNHHNNSTHIDNNTHT